MAIGIAVGVVLTRVWFPRVERVDRVEPRDALPPAGEDRDQHEAAVAHPDVANPG